MTKRLSLILFLIIAFITFYNFIPYGIYSQAPIILTLLFAMITGILVLFTFVNAISFKEFKSIYDKTKHVWSLWTLFITISTVSVVGSFFVYYMNYIHITKNEFKYNSVQTEAILLDKWTEKLTRRFKAHRFVHLKVKYRVGNKELISEHITTGKNEEELPNIGETLKILYSKITPRNFKTEWEYDFANYDHQKDAKQILRKKFIDSLRINK